MAFVIGTAGHIDHGKTALVRQLTGQDTDQLKAEKERGISIDLGFAHFKLADGTPVGVVDVPGHERFIRNMVAGAHGLDLVLFVVAADDGVMPQTEEHFDILCSLGLSQIIFVVSKVDMVAKNRFDEVSQEIEILVDGSRFEAAKILPLNTQTGDGMTALLAGLTEALQDVHVSNQNTGFRMPIDRVFNVHGRGVVITGTQISGMIAVGDEISVVPGNKTYRVRGLQCHGVDVEPGQGGDRLAINLVGAERSDFQRGDTACAPEHAQGTRCFDVSLSIAAHAVADLKTGQRVRLHIGTAERMASVTLLGHSAVLLRAGSGVAQLRLHDPVSAVRGDHFVIRDEQGEHTLGGGRILDPHGIKSRRDDANRLEFLQALEAGENDYALEALLEGNRCVGIQTDTLQLRLNLQSQDLRDALKNSQILIQLKSNAGNWISCLANLDGLQQRVNTSLAEYHKAQPISDGPAFETLHHQAGRSVDPHLFRLALDRAVTARNLTRIEGAYALPAHRAGLTPALQDLAIKLMAAMENARFSPPRWNAKNQDERAIITHLDQRGKLVRVGPDLAFTRAAYLAADQLLEAHFLDHPDITAAQYRDLLGTSRKYALALLETFDRKGRTIRVGDTRKRGKPLAL